jgi:hypothetical protein
MQSLPMGGFTKAVAQGPLWLVSMQINDPMSWKKSKFATSFMNLFIEVSTNESTRARTQEVRQAMLNCLSGLPESALRDSVWARVLYAPDIQALWYLRSDVLTLLAGHAGEFDAHYQLRPITAMFTGLLPAAQKARPRRRRA